jgi:uncharacterized membrane protein YkvI
VSDDGRAGDAARFSERLGEPMPIIIIVLLAILVAQVGFWDTFSAVLGAIGVIVLIVLLAAAIVVLTVLYLVRRVRGHT